MRTKIADRRRLPGLEEKRAELLPAGSMLLVTALDLFDVETLTVSDWALREGHRARRGAHPRSRRLVGRPARAAPGRGREPRAPVQLRRAPHRARHPPRAAPVRRDAVAARARRPTTARCSSSRRCCTTSASTCPARVITGTPRTSSRTRSCAGSTRRRSTFLADARSPPPARRPEAVRSPVRRTLTPTIATALRKLAALLRVADGLDRGRRGVVDDVRADIGADLVILRLRVHGDAELALWGARRRRDLFEQVFGREIEFAVVGHTERLKNAAGMKSARSRETPCCPNVPSWVGTGADIESDSTRTGSRDADAHPGSRGPPGPRTRAGRVQHGRAGQGGGRRPRHGLRALPLEAGGARRARGDRGALGHARSRRSTADADPLRALRDTLAEVCRHWAEHEETMRELRTLAAMTGGEADRRRDRSGRRCASSSKRSPRGGHLRGHWTIDEAIDALAVLTSFATYERLRNGERSPGTGRRRCSPSSRSRSSRPGSRRRSAATGCTLHRPTTVWWMMRAVVSTRSAREMPDRFEVPVERGHALDQRDERGRRGGR